ncbi:hypothetical protein [Desulfovibrio sp. JC010]|uniref:hypothetical protein n=1 Tax=Desulfovibrio sp. JC010 TaxID=2593641 RepID=UPI0013D7CC7F|nr:hypothetical protein [Desulfovibrio sp. JC010]NDV25760.1 hypothetical protein [Desulfovibrio sp. JC010]
MTPAVAADYNIFAPEKAQVCKADASASPFSLSSGSGTYKIGDSTFTFSSPGALSTSDSGQNTLFADSTGREGTDTGINLSDSKFSYKLDTKRDGAIFSTEYLFNKEILELRGAYMWLGWQDRWAGIADVTWSDELLQVATSHAFTLVDETEQEGLGVMRFTLAYLEKDEEDNFAISGKETMRMPQYTAALQYENYAEIVEGYNNEFKGIYSFYFVDGTRETLNKFLTDTTYTSAYVGFGGGSQHVAKLWDAFGNDWFKLSGSLGIEHTSFDEMDNVELSAKDVTSLATEVGATVNVLEWLQLDGGWKWSDTQAVYRGAVNTDAGPAVISFEAQKVDYRYAGYDERFGLSLEFPVWDMSALLAGDFAKAFNCEGKRLNHSDDLILFTHNTNPVTFKRAIQDAKHIEGTADKIIKVLRTKELRATQITRAELQNIGLSIDANGDIIFPAATVWSSVSLPLGSTKINERDFAPYAGQNVAVSTATAVYIIRTTKGSLLMQSEMASKTGLTTAQRIDIQNDIDSVLSKSTVAAMEAEMDSIANPAIVVSSIVANDTSRVGDGDINNYEFTINGSNFSGKTDALILDGISLSWLIDNKVVTNQAALEAKTEFVVASNTGNAVTIRIPTITIGGPLGADQVQISDGGKVILS